MSPVKVTVLWCACNPYQTVYHIQFIIILNVDHLSKYCLGDNLSPNVKNGKCTYFSFVSF